MANLAAIWPGTYVHRGVYYKNPPFENGKEDITNSPYYNVMSKTGITIGAITYIANVRVQEEPSGIVRNMADTIVKSDPMRYFTFRPMRRFAPHQDGAEIIRLMTFADRLMVFTTNALYVLNVAGDNEYMEHQFVGKGITLQSAACTTDYGVAFVNKSGAYLYNGSTIIDLFEKSMSKSIMTAGANPRTVELNTRETASGGDSSGAQKTMDRWDNFIIDGKVCYSTADKKLFIFRGKGEKSEAAGTYDLMGDCYTLHFPTQSWGYVEDMTSVSTTVGSTTDVFGAFQTDMSNDMIGLQQNLGTDKVKLVKYDPAPSNASTSKFRVWSVNTDFMKPDQKKRMFKISVYSIASRYLKLYYSIDGGATKVSVGNLTNASTSDPAWDHFALPSPVPAFNFMFGIYEQTGQTVDVQAQILEINCVYRTVKQKSL